MKGHGKSFVIEIEVVRRVLHVMYNIVSKKARKI